MLLYLILVFTQLVHCQIPSCCSTATTKTCRTHCEQIEQQGNSTINQLTTDQLHYELSQHCATDMEEFWTCLNISFKGLESSSQWLGRHCCSLSPVYGCKMACLKANQTADLNGDCRRSDNIQFFQCLSTLQEGESCCTGTNNIQCRSACLSIHTAAATSVATIGISPTLRQEAHSACSQSPRVLNCANSLLKVDRIASPVNTLQCCMKSEDPRCREACEKALKTKKTAQEAFDVLVKDCGSPATLSENALWQCFLRNSPAVISSNGSERTSQENGIKGKNNKRSRTPNETFQRALTETRLSSRHRISFDAAKLSCCDRGTPKCNHLCRKVYIQDWSQEFDVLDSCVKSPTETSMVACIEDVEDPCQPGCSNLNFCSNFNNRPTELFRSCSQEADAAAQQLFQEWIRKTHVVLPDWEVAMFGPSSCLPSYWKALACVLQFKPCKRNMLRTAICRKDCMKLLSTCLLDRNHSLVVQLCDRLTPRSFNGDCISLEAYLSSQPTTAVMVTPCKYNTCHSGQSCIVDSNNSDGYSCVQGCKLGDMSKMYAHSGSWIQLPTTQPSTCPYGNCHEVCRCNSNGHFHPCHPLPFQPPDFCWADNQRIGIYFLTLNPVMDLDKLPNLITEHGTRFRMDCNSCVCHYGESVCTKYVCDFPSGGNMIRYSCLLQPNPVCSSTGKRYLNGCFARWENAVEHLHKCQDNDTDDLEFQAECYTVIKLVYSKKQIERLQRSTNNSSMFSTELVEQSLQNLLTYLHCQVNVYHSVDGELFAVVHSQLHCASCTAEAEKLVMLFEHRSPLVTLNAHLNVILIAETVQFIQLHPYNSQGNSAPAVVHSPLVFPIPIFVNLISLYVYYWNI